MILNRTLAARTAHARTKENAPDLTGIEGNYTLRHSIKSATIWLSRWAEPLGWATLILVAATCVVEVAP